MVCNFIIKDSKATGSSSPKKEKENSATSYLDFSHADGKLLIVYGLKLPFIMVNYHSTHQQAFQIRMRSKLSIIHSSNITHFPRTFTLILHFLTGNKILRHLRCDNFYVTDMADPPMPKVDNGTFRLIGHILTWRRFYAGYFQLRSRWFLKIGPEKRKKKRLGGLPSTITNNTASLHWPHWTKAILFSKQFTLFRRGLIREKQQTKIKEAKQLHNRLLTNYMVKILDTLSNSQRTFVKSGWLHTCWGFSRTRGRIALPIKKVKHHIA